MRLPRFPDTAVPRLPVVAASVLGTLGAAEAVLAADQPTGGLLAAAALALCATLPVAVAQVHLVLAAAAGTGATLVTAALGHRPAVAALLAQTVMLYLVGARAPGRVAQLFALPYVAYAIGPAGTGVGGRVFGTALLVVSAGALALGATARAGTESASRAAADDDLHGITHAYAIGEERARIARELHDVVAHHISLLSVQADTTRLATPGLPELAATRLLAMGDTARLALAEMRRVLGVLRDDGEAADSLPQPCLAELVNLVDEARQADGSRIHLIVCGRYRRLDPGLEVTAYRIVQEALTNARKHAPGAAVDVEVSFGADALELAVWDTGPAARRTGVPPAGSGFGLVGMRERATMAGGTLETTHGPIGGFVVRAVLPLPVGQR
ncbi:sensor histidine kinase [Dactylosporangium sp. NPDC049525]|uniref:sensor histidine kinase n=1 Tax=Dactylosporangium sp. NPDC049525 TaxID=3154730 RepID=UPI003429F3CE